MGLMEKLRAEFIDIVEWIDDAPQTLAWRFPRFHNQIKNGAKLIVRPGQIAVFVSGGRSPTCSSPARYTLETENLPLLSHDPGLEVRLRQPVQGRGLLLQHASDDRLKWGTPNPIMLRDADFGPVRLRAFGTYTLKATDPAAP